MSKTLFETINQQLTQKPVSPQLGQTEQAQSLLRTKLGKAGSSRQPRLSSVQENVAAQQVRAGANQLQQEGQIQGQQLQQQQMDLQTKEQESFKDILSKRDDIRQQFNLQTENLLQDAERNRQKLDTEEYKAKMEQVGFNMRLGNKQYIDSLEQIAAYKNLDNDLKFKYELANTIFQDEKNILEEYLDFQKLIDADDRSYQEALAKIDANYAYQAASSILSGEAKVAQYQSYGQLAKAGATIYDNQQKKD